MAKLAKDRKNPDLYGNNVYRARTDLPWLWRFGKAPNNYFGETHTLVKRDAEKIAAAEITKIKNQKRENAARGVGPMQWGVGLDKWWARWGVLNVVNDPALAGEVAWLRSTIGADTRCEHIDEKVLEAMLNARAECLVPHTDRKVSPATVNGTMTLTRTILNYLNVVLKVAICPIDWSSLKRKTEKKPIRFLEDSELRAILGELRDDIHDIVEFCLTSGKRINEVLSLTWDKVIDERRAISVQIKGGLWKEFAMSDAAWAVIQRQRGRHAVNVFTFVAERTRPHRNPITKQVVCEHVAGQRYVMTYAVVDRQFRKACAKLGIKGAHLHTLRHTACTWLLAETGDITQVQTMAGHSNLNITREFYAASMEGSLRQGLDKLGARTGKFFKAEPVLVVDNTKGAA